MEIVRIKRSFTLFLCFCLSMGIVTMRSPAAPQWPGHVSIQADGSVVMDADTGTILYGKNVDQQYCPASITKILTVLVVLEHCGLDEMVSLSHDDVYNAEARGSGVGIDEDDVLTVRDRLYVLLLASANKSANVLACHVSGSREASARLMNEKAVSLGCTGSNFTNPSGLNDEDHYTTARDMALVTREAIRNPEFPIVNITNSYRLAPTKRSSESGYMVNHHKMFNKNESIYYLGAFVGKTGYTPLVGNTLVTCVKRDGMTSITVVLNGHQSHYVNTKALLDFGFRNFQSLKVVDYETRHKSLEDDMTIVGTTARDSISLELDRNGCTVTPKDAGFTDTESTLIYDLDNSSPRNGAAYIRYTYNGHQVGFTYFRSLDTESSADLMAAAVILPQVAAGDGNQPVPGQNPGRNSSQNPGQDLGQNLGHEPGQGNPQDQGNDLSTDGDLTPPAARLDITTREDTVSSIRVPVNTLTTPKIVLSLCVIVTIVTAIEAHIKKKEEAGPTLRRQRRLERLEDIGYSSADFDKLVAGRGVPSPSKQRNRRGRRKKTFFR